MTFDDWYYDSLPKRLPARIYKVQASAKVILPERSCTEIAKRVLPPEPPKRQYELPYWRKKKMERKKK